MQQFLELCHLSAWELVRIVLIEMSAGLSTECSQPIERDPVKRSCSRVSSNGPVKELKHTFIHWHLTEAPQIWPQAASTFCVCFEREYRNKLSEIAYYWNLGNAWISGVRGENNIRSSDFLFDYWHIGS